VWGNRTGVSNLAPNFGTKRLELFKELVPRLAQAAEIIQ